jgi:Ni/Co efflux regulator RcnB
MSKKKFFIPALVAAVLGTTLPALAQERGYHDEAGNRYDARDQRHEGRDDRNQRDDGRYQRDDGRYQRGDRMQAERRDDPRDARRSQGGWGRTADYHSGYDGYGPDHNLRRGERLPSRYRTHQYVVDNYRAHHLNRPPRGQQWVQVGADYVLVAAATGLIMQAVMGQ